MTIPRALWCKACKTDVSDCLCWGHADLVESPVLVPGLSLVELAAVLQESGYSVRTHYYESGYYEDYLEITAKG